MNDTRLTVYLNEVRNGMMRFLMLDFNTKTMALRSIKVNGSDTLRGTHAGLSIACNDRYLWLITAYRELLTFDRGEANAYRHRQSKKLDDRYGYLGMQGDKVIAAKIYNSHPLDSPRKTLLRLFDSGTAALLGEQQPAFDFIELSHFGPHHRVDIANNRIAWALSVNYRIKIFNNVLEETATLQRRPRYWLQFNVDEGRKLVKDIPPRYAKAKIDVLAPLYDASSSLNEVHFLSDSVLAVKVRIRRMADGFSQYVWDFWRYHDKKWRLIIEDLRQCYAQRRPEGIITRTDFPILPDRNMLFFGRRYLVVLRFGSGRLPLNKSFRQFAREEDAYIAQHPPRLVADVFRWHFPNR